MYIRFVIHSLDEDSGKRQGIFQAIEDVREAGVLHEYEIVRVKEILRWFNTCLSKPSSFTRSSKPHALNKAISWYKDTAKEHISHMRELVSILEAHDITVDILQTNRPGYIVYEDEYQITAEPFKETGA